MNLLLAINCFIISAVLITLVCRRNLRYPSSHGFYRYFAFLSVAALICLNAPFWFVDRFSPKQLVSWGLLVSSAILVLQGLWYLQQSNQKRSAKQSPGNFAFENTGELVTTGIYRFIRHPMYTSLLLLSWGIWIKQVSVLSTLACLISTVALYLSARTEERENIALFGEEYRLYAERTPRFVPYLF